MFSGRNYLKYWIVLQLFFSTIRFTSQKDFCAATLCRYCTININLFPEFPGNILAFPRKMLWESFNCRLVNHSPGTYRNVCSQPNQLDQKIPGGFPSKMQPSGDTYLSKSSPLKYDQYFLAEYSLECKNKSVVLD